MQVAKTVSGPNLVLLEISATEADLAPIKKHVLGHFMRKVKVPGFRAGKAPLHLIEKHVDRNVLLDEFLEHAINDLYTHAVNEADIRPIAQPKIQMKSFVPFTDLSFEASIETLGPVVLPDYKKLKLPKEPVTITAKEVGEVIKSLQRQMAEKKEVTRAAKNGDEVVIDFNGTDKDGKAIPGADAQGYPLQLSSGAFIPGFEEHMVGLSAGDNKSFDIVFPKDYGAKALQNQKVTFSVTVRKVNELVEPKLDDAFAAKAGPFKTVKELKADIKKQLQLERQTEADTKYENELVQHIVGKTKADIPDSLVQDQLNRMEEAEKQNLLQKGQTWQEHLKEEGLTEEQHRERQRPDAIERIKGGLVLGEIAEREKMEVTPEELEIRIQLLKGQYQDPQMQAELDKPENRRDIANRMLTQKTVAKLVEYTSK